MAELLLTSPVYFSSLDSSPHAQKRRKLVSAPAADLNGTYWTSAVVERSAKLRTFHFPDASIASATKKTPKPRRVLGASNDSSPRLVPAKAAGSAGTTPATKPLVVVLQPIFSPEKAAPMSTVPEAKPADPDTSTAVPYGGTGETPSDERNDESPEIVLQPMSDPDDDATFVGSSAEALVPELERTHIDPRHAEGSRVGPIIVVDIAADDDDTTDSVLPARTPVGTEREAPPPVVAEELTATHAELAVPKRAKRRRRMEDLSIGFDGDAFLKTWTTVPKERPKVAPVSFSQYQASQMESHFHHASSWTGESAAMDASSPAFEVLPRRRVVAKHDPDKENKPARVADQAAQPDPAETQPEAKEARKQAQIQRLAMGGFNGDYWNLPSEKRRSHQPEVYTYAAPESKKGRLPRLQRSVDDEEDEDSDDDDDKGDDDDEDDQPEAEAAISDSTMDLEELQRQREALEAKRQAQRQQMLEARQLKRLLKQAEDERLSHERSQGKKVLDYLFLGNRYVAANFAWFCDNNVRRVVNVTNEVRNEFEGHEHWSINYKRVGIQDSSHEQLHKANRIEEVVTWIQAGRDAAESVLVHCSEGRSRSVSYIIAYLMMGRDTQWDLRRAYQHMSQVNPDTNINISFRQQLMDLERRHFSVKDNSIDLITESQTRRRSSSGGAADLSPPLGRRASQQSASQRSLASSQSSLQRGSAAQGLTSRPRRHPRSTTGRPHRRRFRPRSRISTCLSRPDPRSPTTTRAFLRRRRKCPGALRARYYRQLSPGRRCLRRRGHPRITDSTPAHPRIADSTPWRWTPTVIRWPLSRLTGCVCRAALDTSQARWAAPAPGRRYSRRCRHPW
eukprot:TRINITY_DN6947_c0_g1_i2.p1 TRINITY_DN6947_c0_g1~~TRINITY_DN6947_c0_g1_i2.p1  ORF type:complete len:848 (+),score=179.86 TRINITY_DN6947_c0_g1_i2:140-2683(+)